MIRILHFSDFHYKNDSDLDFRIAAQDICNQLKKESIDFAVFTGDLVNSDKGPAHFMNAKSILIDPILATLNLPHERFMMVPGNHDKTRDREMDAIREKFSSCNSVKELEKILSDERQRNESLVDMTNYLEFAESLYGADAHSKFYWSRKVSVNGKTYGLVGLNSAWRSFDSEKDRGQLLFPIVEVRNAFADMNDCEMIFCAMHHDLSDFKNDIEDNMSQILEKKCSILFTGHYHKCKTRYTYVDNKGFIHSIAPATYNRYDTGSQYGFVILEISDDGTELRELVNRYQDGVFSICKNDPIPIPMENEKRDFIKFNKTIKKRLESGIEEANDAFLTGYNAKNNGFDFLSMFSQPVVRDKSLQEILMSPTKSKGTQYSVEQILNTNENIVIFGSNKCGKSALLRKIYISFLEDVHNRKVIPYFLNCREINADRPIGLKNKLQIFLEMSSSAIDNLFTKYELVLLLDDLDITDKSLVSSLKNEINTFPIVRFVIMTEETVSAQIQLLKDVFNEGDIKRLFFHSLSYKEVHELTNKWPNIPVRKKKDVEKSIKSIFTQMHIPLNYWTVSLFIWLYDKTDETKIRNNFELVRLYVNELLGVDKIVRDRELRIDYEDLLAYLASLAYEILTNDYALTYSQWTNFTEKYKKTHRKVTEDIRNIQELLIQKGVIVEFHKPQHREVFYTFRLKGIFEYFLAYQMKVDKKFLDQVLNEESYYLSFANEIEFYAGFERRDFDSIRVVFQKTKQIFTPLLSNERYEQVDEQLKLETSNWRINTEDAEVIFEEVQKDSYDKNEELMVSNEDLIISSGVEEKVYYDSIEPTIENLEKALFILSRVFRNSDVCDEKPLGDEILNFILTGTCNMGFCFSEQITKEIESKNVNDNLKDAINIVSGYIPLVMQATLFDAISQYNLTAVLEDKLEELSQDVESNQYKYFIIAFILMDLNMGRYSYLLDNLREYITIPVLRYMCHSKCLLMMLKNPENKELNKPYRQLAIDFNQEFKNKDKAALVIDDVVRQQKRRDNQERISIENDYK